MQNSDVIKACIHKLFVKLLQERLDLILLVLKEQLGGVTTVITIP